jgi:hypothetical protein
LANRVQSGTVTESFGLFSTFFGSYYDKNTDIKGTIKFGTSYSYAPTNISEAFCQMGLARHAVPSRDEQMSRSQIRKTAYEYVKGKISKLQDFSYDADHPSTISLNELMLLKDGLTDPSSELVALLKQLLKGSITEADIDAHLVEPFQQHKAD